MRCPRLQTNDSWVEVVESQGGDWEVVGAETFEKSETARTNCKLKEVQQEVGRASVVLFLPDLSSFLPPT